MPRRPRPAVTWLALGVLTFTCWQLLRAVRATAQASFINNLPLPVPALYYQASGVLWTIAGLALLVGLLRPARWFNTALPAVTAAYLAHAWGERLWLGQRNGMHDTVFLIGASLVLLAAAWFIRQLPGVRAYFGETHERTDQFEESPDRRT